MPCKENRALQEVKQWAEDVSLEKRGCMTLFGRHPSASDLHAFSHFSASDLGVGRNLWYVQLINCANEEDRKCWGSFGKNIGNSSDKCRRVMGAWEPGGTQQGEIQIRYMIVDCSRGFDNRVAEVR